MAKSETRRDAETLVCKSETETKQFSKSRARDSAPKKIRARDLIIDCYWKLETGSD